VAPAAPSATAAAVADAPDWFRAALAVEAEVGEVEVDGVAIRYRAWGPAGDGVVLVHGGAAHARWWDHLAPLLVSPGGRRVVAIDLSGHGDSGRRPAYDHPGWAREVLAVAAAAGAGPAPVVIGHSMGGMVALTAAQLFGERLGGVVAVDTPVRVQTPEETAAREKRAFGPLRVYPSKAEAVARFRTVPAQEGELPYVLAHIAEHSLREVEGGWCWKFDPAVFRRSALAPGDLDVPGCRVGLFRAEHGLVPADMGEMIVDRLGRGVPLVEIPTAAHHVMIDQPLALVTGLRALLADWRHSRAERPSG
jgi:pimeloyl-ACP methyl ester carboxylesterase